MIQTHPRLIAAVAIAAASLSSVAAAQVNPERPQDPLPEVDPSLDELEGVNYGVEVGVTLTTAYFFRGINQEDQGFIAQPYFEVGVPILVDDSRGFRLEANVGQWNSFHDEHTGSSGQGPSSWYESDLYGGLTFTTGNFAIEGLYTFYTSPNGAFETIQEVGATLKYGLVLGEDPDDEDAGIALGFAGGAFFETSDNGGSEDAYLQLGVTTGVTLEVGDDLPLKLEFPVIVGLSLDDYYFDNDGDEEFFGYVSVAVAGELPLPVPERYGDWSLTPGLEAIFLGAEGLETANNGDDIELIGSLNLNFAF